MGLFFALADLRSTEVKRRRRKEREVHRGRNPVEDRSRQSPNQNIVKFGRMIEKTNDHHRSGDEKKVKAPHPERRRAPHAWLPQATDEDPNSQESERAASDHAREQSLAD